MSLPSTGSERSWMLKPVPSLWGKATPTLLQDLALRSLS